MKNFLQNIKDVEAAREEIKMPSFMAQLFAGTPNFHLLVPFPEQDAEDKATGDAYCKKLAAYLKEHVDPDEIERTGKIPKRVLDDLAELGCFGLNIPKRYGGLGLSQTNYNRVLALVASYCNILALLLSVHQSIGVSKPLLLFGNEAQKEYWLPRLAHGAISAFALTEPQVGSDPASMRTAATRSADGTYYTLNGEKLWSTNSPIAQIMVVMAKVEGKVTAFIVETNTPGIEIRQHCEFMGCRGIENGWITFTNVRVPAENIIGDVGKGLKIALTSLNTGRISIAALCLGMAQQVYTPAVEWAKKREAFGKKIGYHELNTHKIARMAANIFAMEAVIALVSGMVDRKATDFRVEAATAKLFCSEQLWDIVDTAMQIRGGRGYEKADSLRARGEEAVPIEQIFRDARLYLIGEGASEILKLFIAREVLDSHLKQAQPYLSSSGVDKMVAGVKLASHYSKWYLARLDTRNDLSGLKPALKSRTLLKQLDYVYHTSRRLARTILVLMARYTTRLEQKQALVARIADIGIDLFIITAATLYASTKPGSIKLARQVFDDACVRIDMNFSALQKNSDTKTTQLGFEVLAGKYNRLVEDSLAEYSYERCLAPAAEPRMAETVG